VSVRLQNNVSYGLSQPLIDTPLLPIVSNRTPTSNDKAPIGTIWIDKSQNLAYVLTSVVNDMATWVNIVQGAADFVIFTVQTVDATPTAIVTFSPAPSSAINFFANLVVARADFAEGGGGAFQGSIVRGAAGVPTVVGFTEVSFEENTAGGDLAVDAVVVGNTVQLQVTGIAATVFNWKATVTTSVLP